MPVLVQQHGTPQYISRHTAQSQNQQFSGWWVGRHGKQNWAPRLPGFNRPFFEVWRYIKRLIYGHNVDAFTQPVAFASANEPKRRVTLFLLTNPSVSMLKAGI
jgi:hypothetical protein